MATIAKALLTMAIFFIAIFLLIVIRNGTGNYSTGLFLLIIVAGALSGAITIWTFNPESLENKDIQN